ncbi:hypothetical protein SNE40_013301 [Patella caerulea]|uniref:Uncharacterized protein n=1 Tax=Patella caerulea TaxID=87958 RepID=A0AAN8PTG8_PATCE
MENYQKMKKWFYNGNELEIVDTFNYLGLILNYNGTFLKTQKHVADQGRKALFSVLRVCNGNFFNIETKLSVFDTYVGSILSYGSEIWGFHKAADVKKVQSNFCKRILGVRQTTMHSMIYFELGRFPLYVIRRIRIFKYWTKLLNTDNKILKCCLQDQEANKSKWIINVRNELFQMGLGYIWEHRKSCNSSYFKTIKHRILDIFKQLCIERICNSSKGLFYQHFISNFTLQYYLAKSIPYRYANCISKIRLSAHNLFIETGRYNSVAKNKRLCKFCDNDDVEDEYHFVLICKKYKDIRCKYIKPYYRINPSVYTFIQLLTVHNIKELTNLGKYLSITFESRNKLRQI